MARDSNKSNVLMKRWAAEYHRFITHFMSPLRFWGKALGIVTVLASIVAVVMLVVYVGFEHTESLRNRTFSILRTCQIVFVVNVVYRLLILPKSSFKDKKFKIAVDIAVLFSLLPLVYPRLVNPWLPWLADIIYSSWLTCSVVGVYALLEISLALINMLNKRTNPSLMLSVSFLFFIFIGSFVLMMPRCTLVPLSYIDSLFVASSAVCITGLTTIDVSATFTPLGLLMLGLLIQVGALGVMTFTSFFALFFSGNTSIYNQLMVKDMIYSKSINALLPTLRYILVATLLIEVVGAILIFWTIHSQLNTDLNGELIFSAFTAVSSFCNAGFCNLPDGMSNPMLLFGNQSIYIVLTVLVMAGALGFPILVNFKDIFKQYLLRLRDWTLRRRNRSYPVHIYDVNTRIVLITTMTIFVIGALLFFVFESGNTMKDMNLYERIVQSFFNACTPRSAGFTSVNPADFLDVTILIILFQMWIGGGSQSTAGGVKVNTFAAIILNLKSIVLGRERVVVFNRTISYASIRRANAVVTLSIISLFVFSLTLIWLEPAMSVKALVFETTSAIFTVGSSLGVTPYLSSASKIVLCLAMFLGRVGIISLLVGISGNPKNLPVKYPTENLIIN